MSKTSEKVRVEWKAGDAVRDRGLSTPEDIVRYDNILYGENPLWNILDVYRPINKKGKLPVIINVHGGGWVYGDKDLYQFYAMSLAQRGFAVVNYSYRLAPEAKFPSSLEDTNDVICWMYENQEQYGLNMDHVFMVGDSAGGHLAALYSAICTNQNYAKNYRFQIPERFVPTALALNCGAYVLLDKITVLSEEEDRDLMNDLLPDGGSKEEKRLICVPDHVTKDFPPVYLMTCLGDICFAHVPFLYDALKKNNVYCECKVYGTKEAPLYHVFHLNMHETKGKECNDIECDFFRRFL